MSELCFKFEWGSASQPPPSPNLLTNIQDYHDWQESEECFGLRLSQIEAEESALWTFDPRVVFLGLRSSPSLSVLVSARTIRNFFDPRQLSQWNPTYQTAKV